MNWVRELIEQNRFPKPVRVVEGGKLAPEPSRTRWLRSSPARTWCGARRRASFIDLQTIEKVIVRPPRPAPP